MAKKPEKIKFLAAMEAAGFESLEKYEAPKSMSELDAHDEDNKETWQENPFNAGTVGRPFLEKLLLALIDGQDEANAEKFKPNKTRETRLRAAVSAITGAKYPRSTRQHYDDELLQFMAGRYFAANSQFSRLDLVENVFVQGEFEPFSNLTELARQALDHFSAWSKTSDERAQTQRLMNKFRKHKQTLIQSFKHADSLIHHLEHQKLARIAELLQPVDIHVKIPDRPEAF